MKFVFICGAGIVSGKEIQTFNMMRHLRGNGHSVFCIMSYWGTDEYVAMLESEKILFARLRIGFISKTMTFRAIKMTLHQLIHLPLLWWRYSRLLNEFRADAIVHTNFHHLFLLLPSLGRAKQVFYVHDLIHPSSFTRRLFKLFNRKIDLFIGVSEFITQLLLALGTSAQKTVLVYNGINCPINIKSGEFVPPVIGIVGQIGAWKGHEFLIRSLADLKEHRWHLKVIGDGERSYRVHLENVVNELDLIDRVTFAGRMKGLTAIYSGLSIVCVPTLRDEPFGLSAAEPGFFKIPVVCSATGGLPEIVKEGKTGLLVPPGDTRSLATAIKRLLEDPQEARLLGNNAYEFVQMKFSMEVVGPRFEEVLLECVGNHDRAIVA